MAFFAVLSTALLAQAPEEKKEPAKAPGAAPRDARKAMERSSEEFRKLPLEYRLLVMEALKRFQTRDFTGALSFVDKADALQIPGVWTLNVRGAVAIEKRNFEEGAKYCQQALGLEPDFFPAKFNLCEIPFLQGRYPVARQMWEKLLGEYPINPTQAKEDGTPELLVYRIFLCYMLEKDLQHAKEWMDRIPFPSTTPAYHYANAVWERQHGRQDKWDEWLQQAEFIWPEIKRANFTDVLIQLGWMKPAFGEKLPEIQIAPEQEIK